MQTNLKNVQQSLSNDSQVSESTKVSPSRIGSYQDCPKKYDYVYNKSLAPVGAPKTYFDKGNYIHELCHVYYQLIQQGYIAGSEFIMSAIRSKIQTDINKAEGPELIVIYNTALRTMTRFITQQSPRIDRGITVVGTEQELSHELTLPSGRKIVLFGFIDLIYRDSSGKLRIRDHKTGERPWTKQQAASSNQLLYYSVATYLRTREVPIAEISYLNTHEYVKKAPPLETAFAFPTVTYTKRELENYLTQVLQLIDTMLDSTGVPHYGNHCNWCPFLTPCTLERKGIDPAPIISSQYKVVDRNVIRQHPKFTEEHSSVDDPD